MCGDWPTWQPPSILNHLRIAVTNLRWSYFRWSLQIFEVTMRMWQSIADSSFSAFAGPMAL